MEDVPALAAPMIMKDGVHIIIGAIFFRTTQEPHDPHMGDVTSFVRALVNSRLLALAAAQGFCWGAAVFLRVTLNRTLLSSLLVSVLNALPPCCCLPLNFGILT
jgi:hypothetical protein